MNYGQTHWNGCEHFHVECAIAQLERSRAEVERLREALRVVRPTLDTDSPVQAMIARVLDEGEKS